MSLSGALSSSISGLSAQSQALAMVSDNLANASTVGYKTTTGMFEDLVTGSSSATEYSSGGVNIYSRQNVTQQGLLQATTNATDVGIQGQGFFVVSSSPTNGEVSYTRNGAFLPDDDGYLVNQGSYLMGYPIGADGSVGTTLQAINTNIEPVSVAPTTKSTIAANLPSDAVAGASFTTSVPVYDSLGTANTVEITWTKSTTDADTWTGTIANPVSTSNPAGGPTGSASGGPITVVFNPDGSLKSTSPASPTLSITGWDDGAASSSVALNLGTANGTDGLTQYNSGESTPLLGLKGVNSNGLPAGKLSSISIGKNGIVNATYSNEQTIPIYEIPVATFDAPDDLAAQSNGLYTATAASGNATLQVSGQGGAGTVFGGELESSATNTNDQFSTMMTAQQAYSASAQVVTAVNKMFDTLISAMR
jgi:flagellar hook protein FlgE